MGKEYLGQYSLGEGEITDILLRRHSSALLKQAGITKILGEGAIDEIYDLLEDSFILDEDEIILRGGVFQTLQEVTEYILANPGFHDLMGKLRLGAFKIIARIPEEKIYRWIADSIDIIEKEQKKTLKRSEEYGGLRATIGSFMARAVASNSTCPVSYREKVNLGVDAGKYVTSKLAKAFEELRTGMALFEIPNYSTARNHIVSEIGSQLMEYFAIRVIMIMSNTERWNKSQIEIIMTIFIKLDELYAVNFGKHFIGVHLVEKITNCQDVITRNRGEFEKFLEESDQNRKNISIAELRELSEFRTVPHKAIQFGDAELHFFGDEFVSHYSQSICHCRLVLDKTMPVNQPIVVPIAGSSVPGIIFQNNGGCIEFSIDRSDGELMIADTTTPLYQSGIVTVEEYEKLKQIVYRELAAYMESRERDLPEYMDIAFLERFLTQAEGITQEVKEGVIESTGETIDLLGATRPVEEAFQNPDATKPKQQKKRVRSMKTREVLRALIHLLGKPEHGKGSHFIFRAKGGGKPYPIPLGHTEETSLKVIGHYLKKLGVSDRELIAAL